MVEGSRRTASAKHYTTVPTQISVYPDISKLNSILIEINDSLQHTVWEASDW